MSRIVVPNLRTVGLRQFSFGNPVYDRANLYPTFDADFETNKSLVDNVTGKNKITWSRSASSSPGTYINKYGLIQTSQVNLALYSEQFDNAAWLKINATVSANQIVSPDGKQTADKITATASGDMYVYRSQSAGDVTISIYAKANTVSSLQMYVSGSTKNALFDLSNGTYSIVSGSGPDYIQGASITDVGNGWYRCSIVATFTVTRNVGLYFPGASAGDSIYIWGAQIETTDPELMGPSPYIKTTSAAVAAPRFDHEPATGNITTNLLTYSEQFDNAAWGKGSVTVTANATTSPDGQQVADEANFTASNSVLYTNVGTTVVPLTQYVYSVWMRAKSGTFKLKITRMNGVSYTTATVSDEITLTEDWQRYTLNVTIPLGETNSVFVIGYEGKTPYTLPATGSIYVYGAQLEEASTVGPYVRTISTSRSISDQETACNGLLVEESRTNLQPYSEQFDNASAWLSAASANFSILSNSAVSPDGKNTGFKIAEVATNTSHYIHTIDGSFLQINSGTTYTFSVFAKKGTGASAPDIVQLAPRSSGFSTTPYANFNISTGTVTLQSNGTASIEDYGNGWFRLSLSAVATTTTITNTGIVISFCNNNPTSARFPTYIGSVTSDFFIFGAQVEAGSFNTSYIPTTTTALVRGADIAAVQDDDFSTTNLLSYSESFDVGWGLIGFDAFGGGSVANAIVAPDGQTTADFLRPSTATGFKGVDQSTSFPATATKTVYVKDSGVRYVQLNYSSSRSLNYANYDLQTATVTQTGGAGFVAASITDAGNGWLKLSITETGGTGTWTHAISPIPSPTSPRAASYTGDGTSGIFLWAAQLTATEFPVPYVSTRNLLKDSQDFERSSWVKVNGSLIDDDVTQAPDGTMTADRIRKNTTSFQGLRQNTITVPGVVVESIYAKKDTTDNIAFTNGALPVLIVSLTNGSLIYDSGAFANVSVVDTGNGWYRISYSRNASSGVLPVYFWPTDRTVPLFDTISSTASAYIWAAQVEPGSTATEYLRTTDVVGKNYNWYEPTEGTVFIDIPGFALSDNSRAFYLGNQSLSSRLADVLYIKTYNRWDYYKTSDASQITIGSQSNPDRITLSYKHNDYNGAIDGTLGGADTSTGNLATSDKMSVGQHGLPGGYLNGHIRRLVYFPRRIKDSNLQLMTGNY